LFYRKEKPAEEEQVHWKLSFEEKEKNLRMTSKKKRLKTKESKARNKLTTCSTERKACGGGASPLEVKLIFYSAIF
jgi:hypothetical protein